MFFGFAFRQKILSMDSREQDDIFVVREEDTRANRHRQVFCVFCYKQRSLNNLRRHMDVYHPDESKGKLFESLYEIFDDKSYFWILKFMTYISDSKQINTEYDRLGH